MSNRRWPTEINERETLDNNFNISHTTTVNDIEIGVRVSSSLTGPLQDAFVFADCGGKFARNGELEKLFKNTARKNNPLAEHKNNSASVCVAYIPSDLATTAPDSVVTLNTGDTHAMLFVINGDKITAKLLTENHHDSSKFFSKKNEDKRNINNARHQNAADANILPKPKPHNIKEFKENGAERIIVATITDGAFKGIDNFYLPPEAIQEIEEKAAQVVREWFESNETSMLKLADRFVKRARSEGETDCITAVLADITTPPKERGIVIGAVDGARGSGGGTFAQATAITLSKMAKEHKTTTPTLD